MNWRLVNQTIKLIRQLAIKDEPYYVAFSGGKDSVVLLDLVKEAGVPFDAHYNWTTVDPPELVKFIRTFPEVEFHRPKRTMLELIPYERIPPHRSLRYCCTELKEYGGKKRFKLTGVRAEESPNRAKNGMFRRDKYSKQTFSLSPMFDWSEHNVWDYIDEQKLAYCSLYDEDGMDRLGCIGCPLVSSGRRRWQLERWPQFKKMYLLAFDRMLKARVGHWKWKADSVEWKSAEEVLEHYLSQP